MKKPSTSPKGSASSCTFRAIRQLMVMLIYAGSVVAPSPSHGVELKEQTQKIWDAYLQAANPQMGSQTPFLWADQLPERLQRVRGGEILVSSVGQQNPKPRALRVDPRLDRRGLHFGRQDWLMGAM